MENVLAYSVVECVLACASCEIHDNILCNKDSWPNNVDLLV